MLSRHSKHLDREAFTHSKCLHTASFYTQQAFDTQHSIWHTESFYAQQALTPQKLAFTHSKHFTHSKPLHTASFYTQPAFTHSKPLHREAFTHSKSLHTEAFIHSKRLHREAFTHSRFSHASIYTAKLAFTHSKLLHTASLYTQPAFTHSKLVHTASIYTQQAFTPSKLLHREAFTNRSFHTHTHRKPLRCQAKGSDTVPAAGSVHREHIKISWGHHSLRPMKKEASGYGRRACRRQWNSSIFHEKFIHKLDDNWGYGVNTWPRNLYM